MARASFADNSRLIKVLPAKLNYHVIVRYSGKAADSARPRRGTGMINWPIKLKKI